MATISLYMLTKRVLETFYEQFCIKHQYFRLNVSAYEKKVIIDKV